MDAPLDDLYRAAPAGLAVRADDNSDGRLATLDITFARFGVWNEIDSWLEGRFLERLSPGAFSKTMQERRGAIKALFDHGYDPQIGNKVLGDIEDIGERQAGPFMQIALHDTSYGRDLLPGLRSGAYGASYRFRVVKETWEDEPGRSDHNPLGLPERTIQEVKLYEAGPVTFPADEGTTVGVRSLTDRFCGTRPDEVSRAADTTPEPPSRHSRGLTHEQRARALQLLTLEGSR